MFLEVNRLKVNELKDILKKYNEKDKDKIIIELYKRIPKAKKEEYNIDEYISDINKKVEKDDKNVSLTIEALEGKIEYFCECARSELYVSPNRVIPKAERSKWRFRVMSFYKQLNSFSPETDEGKRATKLLKDLFVILSNGTHYLTFSSWNTFGAIQVSQPEYLRCIIERTLVNGITRENLEFCVKLLNVAFDPMIFHCEMLDTFCSCMPTPDSRKLAIELLKEQIEAWKEKYKKYRKSQMKEQLNYLVDCILYIYIDLYEPQEGIKYFLKEYIEKDPEVKEYILLNILEKYELYEEWIKEYESKHKKINFRAGLKEKYNKIKKQV